MIYIEKITDNDTTFFIERQKNKPNSKWYGLWIYGKDEKSISDNEFYILGILNREQRPLNLTDEELKILHKVIKKADKLGWFKDTKIK